MGYRKLQSEYMHESRKSEREITIPHVANPDRRKACEADDELFLTTYFPHLFCDAWTEDRRRILAEIGYRAENGGDKALAAPRGGGKTVIAEGRVGVKGIVTGELKFPLIVAATGPDSDRMLANIKTEYETNELLLEDFPEVCAPIQALEGAPQRANMQTYLGKRTRMKWAGNFVTFPTVMLSWCPECFWPECVEGKDHWECPKCKGRFKPWKSRASGAILMTRGLDASIRGIRVGSRRPDFVLIDDPETEESARSDVQIENRMETVEKGIGGLGGPRRRVARLMLTTIQAAGCLSAIYTDKSRKPSWDGERLALVVRWPDRKDLWERYIELRHESMQDGDRTAAQAAEFYVANREEMDHGAKVSNESRFDPARELSTIQFVHNEAADKGWDYVFAELQNDPPDLNAEDEKRLTASKVRGSAKGYTGRVNGLERGTVPDDAIALTATVDCQSRDLWYEVCAWLPGKRRHVVDYGSFGDRTLADTLGVAESIRANLRDLRMAFAGECAKQVRPAAPYCKKGGEVVELNMVLVDESYEPATVQGCCAEFGEPWRPARGDPTYHHPTSNDRNREKRPARNGDRWYEMDQQMGKGRRIKVFHTDVTFWKHRSHDSWTIQPSGSPEGCVTLFGFDARSHVAFSEMIVAEEWREEFVEEKGVKMKWIPLRNDNHYLDTDYMQFVAGSMCGVWRHTHKTERPERKKIVLSEIQAGRRK